MRFNCSITRVREVSCLKWVQDLFLATIWRTDFRAKITPTISPGVRPKFFGQFLGGFSLFGRLKPNEDEKKKKIKLFYWISRDWENPAKLSARSRLLGFRRSKRPKRGVWFAQTSSSANVLMLPGTQKCTRTGYTLTLRLVKIGRWRRLRIPRQIQFVQIGKC